MPQEHIHFVTGRLAEPSLRRVVEALAPAADFDYSIGTLGISVAALMTPEWVARRLQVPSETTQVMLPGYCSGDLTPVAEKCGRDVVLGPKDLRDLPQFFGEKKTAPADNGLYDIEILAEINFAPRLPLAELLAEARRLSADGADLIDIGCEPGVQWSGVEEAVRALRGEGLRVSIDSMDPQEVEAATRAGAELVLSVNSSNRDAARDWGCEVVAIPDDPSTLAGLDETVEHLSAAGVRFRIDPIIEPIGFGFAQSLARYLEVRRRYPDAEMLMGIGNLTELTDCDSAGANVLLLGFCQELGIRSVLTTQVINWARTSVKECNLARRLVYHAHTQRTLPKHAEPRLIVLRDERVHSHGDAALDEMAAGIRDPNYRLFAEGGKVHLVTAGLHLSETDPFVLFDKLREHAPANLDASHAFYLGYELAKAVTALTLSKDYRQDQALDWGYLTQPEPETAHTRRSRAVDSPAPDDAKVLADELPDTSQSNSSAAH